MKKTFQVTHPKIKPARLIETVRSDVKKYLKRERKKNLPDGVDFWDFDCKFGSTESEAKVIHVNDIGISINSAEEQKLESFYIEILAKPGLRIKKSDNVKTDDSSTTNSKDL
ncbi:MAG: hypothetical protein COA79_00960 [Planctomycetota bacterium]|nr:MAG: hypothetical protein COA79_00960 [Planctomycetota bacterium]